MRIASSTPNVILSTPAAQPQPERQAPQSTHTDTVVTGQGNDGPGFFQVWKGTIAGVAIGAGAGLYAGLHGGTTGAIAGGVAGGLGGMIVGTAGSARLGFDKQSFNIGMAAGVLGVVGGAVAGHAGHLGAGLLLAAAGGAGGGFIGMMSGWKD